MHWKRLHPERGFQAAVGDMGLALTLATLTTVIGFGSLEHARGCRACATPGILVALGLSACLLATVLVLPALEGLLPARRTARNRLPEPEPWENKATDAKETDDGKDERRLS